MVALGIDASIRELMQRLHEHEQLLYERLWVVQTPADFRAVMQMRAQLERMRAEVVERSLALGLARGGPPWSYVEKSKPRPAPEVHYEALAKRDRQRTGFGYIRAILRRTPCGSYQAEFDLYSLCHAISDDVPALYPTRTRAVQAAIRTVLKRWPEVIVSEPEREELDDMRAQVEAKLICQPCNLP